MGAQQGRRLLSSSNDSAKQTFEQEGKEIMKRAGHMLAAALIVLLVVGTALGQEMTTFTSEQEAQRHCPTDTVVWLNLSSAVYHFKGERWYGRTKRGAYVCKTEADKNGERATQNGQ